MTGIITERSGSTLLVDEGATREPQVIAIQPRSLGRIQVRFPTLEPGYLVDIIGCGAATSSIGMIPATSQPAYPAHRLPAAAAGQRPRARLDQRLGDLARAARRAARHPRRRLPGAGPGDRLRRGRWRAARASGYARMPYLAIGSVLRVRNDCTGKYCLLPVTGCAPIARLFNDRCVTCGTSPRGRVADLTLASFIALGGELERGCFNATITIGE